MKTRLGVFFGVWVVLALFAVPAFAAETGAAAGRVFDLATNAGVGGVVVVATCSIEFDEDKPYARVEVTTGADGGYTFPRLLANRTYGLSFTKASYIVEARWNAAIVSGKTRRMSDIALCPIPVNHGVYRLTDEGAKFLQQFMRDPSARPAHPLTYEPLPQATYTKTPVSGKEGEFTRTFTVSRGTVIPQILHKHDRSPGEALLILFDAAGPAPGLRTAHEDSSDPGERRFIGGTVGSTFIPSFEISSHGTKGFLEYTGVTLGEAGYCNFPADRYVVLLTSGTSVFAFLFEVVDTVSGDEVTRCKNILTIMRHEIAAFRQQNGRWPTSAEICKFEILMFNPLCARSECVTVDADALHLAKGTAYTGEREVVAWLYSPSTGELWPATASGNGEAGW